MRRIAAIATTLAALALPAAAGAQAPPVDIQPSDNEVLYGQSILVSGRASGYGGPVRLEADGFIFGDAFGVVAEATADSEGRFRFPRIKPPRNTRYRVNAGGRLSPARTVYTDLRFSWRFRAEPAPGAARGTVDIVGPPDAVLVDPSAVMYIRRGGSRTLRRLGSGELREHADGRFRAVIRGRLPASNRPYSYTPGFCLEEPRDDGFGRRYRIDELCGRSRIPYSAVFQLVD